MAHGNAQAGSRSGVHRSGWAGARAHGQQWAAASGSEQQRAAASSRKGLGWRRGHVGSKPEVVNACFEIAAGYLTTKARPVCFGGCFGSNAVDKKIVSKNLGKGQN